MRRDEYYVKIHGKELPSFNEIVRRVRKGLLLITSCHFEKLAVGDGYRFIVYFVEKR
jgi:hypothetical protein